MGFCEIDKKAETAYRAMYDAEKEVFFSDASKIDTGEMPDFDLFVGGFPCRPFSAAGKRRGLKIADFLDTKRNSVLSHCPNYQSQKTCSFSP